MSLPEQIPQNYPEAPQPIRAVRVRDELVIPLDPQSGFALVQSRSAADTWHVVEQQRCTCKAFRYRETCRHLGLAAAVTKVLAAIAAEGRPPVRAGEQPPGWSAPAVLDEVAMLAEIELLTAESAGTEPRFFARKS
jgi:hypothetical protein